MGLEYNFYEYDISSPGKSATPYILVELASFQYKSVADYCCQRQISYTNKTSYAIPFGVGYKSKLRGAFAFAIEAKVRYTFEDDLDYTTGRFPALDFGRQWKRLVCLYRGFTSIYIWATSLLHKRIIIYGEKTTN